MALSGDSTIDSYIYLYYQLQEDAGFGKAQLWILLATSFLIIHVFSELMGLAIVAPAAQCDLKMDDRQKAILYGATFFGVLVSSFSWNSLAGLKGRKWVLFVSSSMAILTSFLSTFSRSYGFFVLMRFIVGLFIAGTSFSAFTYLAEFCPLKHRKLIIHYMSIFNGLGMISCPGWAEYLVPHVEFHTYRPWKLLTLLYILPGMLGLLLLWKLPESPEYFLCSNKWVEVRKILQWTYRMNRINSEQIPDIPERLDIPEVVCVRFGDIANLSVSVQKSFILTFSLSCFILCVLCSIGHGLGIWYTDLRNRQLRDPKDAHMSITLCQEMTLYTIRNYDPDKCQDKIVTYRDSILLGFGFLVVFIIISVMMIRIQEKYIITYSLVICAISGIGLMLFTEKTLTLISFILFLAVPNAIMSLNISTMVKFTSSKFRSTFVCISCMLGRLGSIQGAITVGLFINSHCELVFLTFTLLICALISRMWCVRRSFPTFGEPSINIST